MKGKMSPWHQHNAWKKELSPACVVPFGQLAYTLRSKHLHPCGFQVTLNWLGSGRRPNGSGVRWDTPDSPNQPLFRANKGRRSNSLMRAGNLRQTELWVFWEAVQGFRTTGAFRELYPVLNDAETILDDLEQHIKNPARMLICTLPFWGNFNPPLSQKARVQRSSWGVRVRCPPQEKQRIR